MTLKNLKSAFVFLTAIFCFISGGAQTADAQRRDHLSAMEVEIVREAQEIDRRTEVFVKAIDRRFLVLNKDNSQAKQVQKDIDIWGELPTGTRLQLFTDIRRLLEESINNIDDVAAHNKTDAKLFPKAVRTLAEAADRYLPRLKAELTRTADEREKSAILSSIEYCGQIIEASVKVPKEEVKEKKKKHDN